MLKLLDAIFFQLLRRTPTTLIPNTMGKSFVKGTRFWLCLALLKETSYRICSTALFNYAMEDIRQKQHALEVKRVWELVMRDPHLKRLGDWLVNEEEETKAEKWRLERLFLKTPWIWDLKVILVESPHHDVTVPFVEVVNIKGKSHEGCPFSRMESRQEKEGSLCVSGKNEIPGMWKEKMETGSAVPFRKWEKREKS